MNVLQLNNFRPAPHSEPVDLCFEPGQIGVVLGRNNSGKTNLLRAVAGLESRASGEFLLDGVPLPDLRSGARSVGFVFQAFVNYPHWTVQQNIESPMRGARNQAKPRSRAERIAEVSRIADTLQLSELLERKPSELSGGQQQRLAIGRALASDARVLLLDEPFVNLDFRLRERLTEEFGELLRANNTTAIFASSDCRDAFALGDSLVLLADQQVLQQGSPLGVYRAPESLEAAHLMSEPAVNWFVRDSGQPSLVTVVRPEHMNLVSGEFADGSSLSAKQSIDQRRFRLRVEAVETSGSHTFVQGRLLTESYHRVSQRWVARLDGMPDIDRALKASEGSAENSLLFEVDARNLFELNDESVAGQPSAVGDHYGAA